MKMTKYKLGELVEVTRGASLSGQFYAEEGKLIRLTLGNFNMNGGGFKENTSKTDLYFTGTVRDEFILNKGDIITPLTEQSLGLLGTTARIPESGKYIQSQDVALVRCKEGLLDPNFCYYLISSSIVRQQLSAAAQQTKIRHTSPEKIKDCTVWVPDFEVQKNIGRILTDIDNKIAINRRINDNLEAMAKQLYDYWFVQFDFPNEEGKPYKSSGGAMVWNEKMKREIPQGWDIQNLADCLNLKTERVNISDIKASDNYTPIEVIPRKQMSLHETAPLENAVSGICIYNRRNILLSNRRVYFHKVCIAPFDGLTRDTVLVLEPYNSGNLGYLYETVFADEFILFATKHSYGSEQPVLSWTAAQKYNVLKPSNSIDKKYSEIVDSIIESVLNNQIEIIKLTKQRDELLPLLMNGQASVNYHLSAC